MYLEKEMNDLGNRNIKILVWIPARIEFLAERSGEERVGIAMDGYVTEADYLAGRTPIETRRLMVPLTEPEDGDEFTTLRPAIVAIVADVQSKAMALCKKMQEWSGAVEK